MSPSSQSAYFDLFSLPVRYELDLSELEARYREASRHWHPDRFSRAPASERAEVLRRATDLNQAYRVLKSEARRAEYLLKLRGVDLASEEPGKQPAMDPEFLGEVLELREELLEARRERDLPRLQRLRTSLDERSTALRKQLAADFARLESGDDSVIARLTKTVLAQRYYQRFFDEIDAAEEATATI